MPRIRFKKKYLTVAEIRKFNKEDKAHEKEGIRNLRNKRDFLREYSKVCFKYGCFVTSSSGSCLHTKYDLSYDFEKDRFSVREHIIRLRGRIR